MPGKLMPGKLNAWKLVFFRFLIFSHFRTIFEWKFEYKTKFWFEFRRKNSKTLNLGFFLFLPLNITTFWLDLWTYCNLRKRCDKCDGATYDGKSWKLKIEIAQSVKGEEKIEYHQKKSLFRLQVQSK